LEKRKAHHPLATVKRLIAEGRVSFTMTAAAGGFDSEEMLEVVTGVKPKDLCSP